MLELCPWEAKEAYGWQMLFTARTEPTQRSKILCSPVRKKTFKNTSNHHSVQFSSVAQSCLTLCDHMNRSVPGLPVYYQLPESSQTHFHWISDAIQPFHPLSIISGILGTYPPGEFIFQGPVFLPSHTVHHVHAIYMFGVHFWNSLFPVGWPFVQPGPKLGIRRWFHEKNCCHSPWRGVRTQTAGPGSCSREWGSWSPCYSPSSRGSSPSLLWLPPGLWWPSQPAGVERAGLGLGYPGTSWNSAPCLHKSHYIFVFPFPQLRKKGRDWRPWWHWKLRMAPTAPPAHPILCLLPKCLPAQSPLGRMRVC